MPRRQAENTEKKNQKERRVMSQKERVDLIEVDLLDMCKYILSKWVFILIGMVVFAGAGFGYAKVKSVTEYSSKMQVYVTVPKTSDKVLIRDNASAPPASAAFAITVISVTFGLNFITIGCFALALTAFVICSKAFGS